MKELNPFDIDEKTEPSYETPEAKWYLIKKTKHYATWRWNSKKDATYKTYLVTDIKTGKIVRDDTKLESILFFIDLREAARRSWRGIDAKK